MSIDAIPQTDPKAGYVAQRAEIDAAVARVLDGGWYILGREVAAFETEFAAYIGVKHGVGVANGTDALVLALRACEIGPGDVVATVSHTAVATVAAIELAGATPLLLDIDPATCTLDPAELERVLAAPAERHGRIAAVIPVHLYGQPADLEPIAALARRHGAKLIEDCAQCHGATYDGRRVGSFGDVACFSLYPTKNLGALGDGGIVVTSDDALARAVRELREYGWRERYVSERAGMNSRLDELQAAILRVKLAALDADNMLRQRAARIYDEGLAGLPLMLPLRQRRGTHVFHQYVVRHAARDALREALKERGIGTNIHYPLPVHQQPAYRGRIATGPSGMTHTERVAREALSLPMFPQLGEERAARVVAAVRDSCRAL